MLARFASSSCDHPNKARAALLGVSLCRRQHDEQHRIGRDVFSDKYGIDLWALAAEFARRSPDWEMRASLKLIPAGQISSG